MTYFTYLYILPALICFLFAEFEKEEYPNMWFCAIVPGINLLLAVLAILMYFCKLMIWIRTDD